MINVLKAYYNPSPNWSTINDIYSCLTNESELWVLKHHKVIVWRWNDIRNIIPTAMRFMTLSFDGFCFHWKCDQKHKKWSHFRLVSFECIYDRSSILYSSILYNGPSWTGVSMIEKQIIPFERESTHSWPIFIVQLFLENGESNGMARRKAHHGFVPRRFCLTNLLIAEEQVTKLMDAGEEVDLVYLDFAKAFDSIHHRILCDKIHAYGIHQIIIDGTRVFLFNRTFKVRVTESRSAPVPACSGVPQGSALAPFCFSFSSMTYLTYCRAMFYCLPTMSSWYQLVHSTQNSIRTCKLRFNGRKTVTYNIRQYPR